LAAAVAWRSFVRRARSSDAPPTSASIATSSTWKVATWSWAPPALIANTPTSAPAVRPTST
jgi:hypothetical protein